MPVMIDMTDKSHIEYLQAQNAEMQLIISDFLESYLATFGGNEDDLVHRARRALEGDK